MKILDCGPLRACTDCYLLIGNDDDSGAPEGHRERFAAWQAEVGDNDLLVPGDAHEHFSSARCDGCGTTAAGDRHEIFAFELTIPPLEEQLGLTHNPAAAGSTTRNGA